MSQKVKGNTRSLAPSQIRNVERLFQRRLDKDELVTLDFARELYRLAADLRRRVGVLVSRDGVIEEVFLGSKDILYLPDLGRYRFGQGRLRRLRLIFSDLSNNHTTAVIPSDIYADLEKLRLDMVVSVKEVGNRTTISYAHVLPRAVSAVEPVRSEVVSDLARFEMDYGLYMEELESELSLDPSAQVSAHPRAVLVGVYDKGYVDTTSAMAELKELARTAGVEVVDTFIQKRTPDPKTLLGKGKLEEVVLRCLRLGCDMLIFDGELKPGQWRAITNSTELKVLDRSMLILDIFAQRAKSSEGRLQVELAQLKFNLPRLVEKDAGLSRLSGGIGGRGPGETKLEIGRRRMRERISELDKRIKKIGDERELRRRRRSEREIPLVAILGYTNVGKSTLFNALTGSSVVAENKLFATLEPAQRRYVRPDHEGTATLHERTVVFSDTVGFIRQLPSELFNAFRATLEEVEEASLIIHVLDATDPDIEERKASVDRILADMELKNVPVLVVLNKIDKVPDEEVMKLAKDFDAHPVSAVKKAGFEELLEKIYGILVPAGGGEPATKEDLPRLSGGPA